VIAPFKQFQKLRDFMENKLPPGFPVKIGEYLQVFNWCWFYLSTRPFSQ